jgi:uncharacterized C2H2 Zn-finger protein
MRMVDDRVPGDGKAEGRLLECPKCPATARRTIEIKCPRCGAMMRFAKG